MRPLAVGVGVLGFAAVSLLSACATQVSVADMYGPNFGLRVLPHFDAESDPDPKAVVNGLYAPRPLQGTWLRSPSQAPSAGDTWAP